MVPCQVKGVLPSGRRRLLQIADQKDEGLEEALADKRQLEHRVFELP
jgi:hypothetical protein